MSSATGPVPQVALPEAPPKVTARGLNFYYGEHHALKNINLTLGTNRVTAFIGPSGCGKSTLLRIFNRMYDLYPGQRATGQLMLDQTNILDPKLDLNLLRARVGMVFQKPTPFPMTIYENIAFGIRLYEKISKSEMDGRVEKALRGGALWNEVKDKLNASGSQPLRRPAAAALHRPHRRGAPRGDPVRRALLGARPDLDRQGRGIDPGIVGGLHHRHRHPQHAAGGARLRQDRLHVSRRTDRVRRHQQDLHLAERSTHPGLHHRPVRLSAEMNKTWLSEHTAKAFDSDLQELTRLVAEMGGLAERMITESVDALIRRDVALGKRVVAADIEIDNLQRMIEERAVLTIARRQPMAIDLREIVGAMRVATDLERIGDLAKNMGKRVAALENDFQPLKLIRGLEHMTDLVQSQVKSVLDAYAAHDLPAAMAVWKGDEEVDAICTSLFRELLTYMMEDPRNISFCIHLMFCAKNIERIGDHATNIAETVFYMIEGQQILDKRPKGDMTTFATTVPGN